MFVNIKYVKLIVGLLLLLVFHPRAAIMCIGPAVAIPAAVKAVVLKVIDIELFEINEVIIRCNFFFFFLFLFYFILFIYLFLLSR